MPQHAIVLAMANIQGKNVFEKLHNQLRRYARDEDCTIGEIVLEAIARDVTRRECTNVFRVAFRHSFATRPLTCSKKNSASGTGIFGKSPHRCVLRRRNS